MTQKGIKYSADKVVSINKLSNGKIIFLEQGNSNSGLQHIIERHGSDFLSIGIKNEQIPSVLMKALSENKIVGYQGKSIGRPIYEVQFNNKKVYIAITTGNNGYIVGANPTRVKEVK
ncbi:hypothetical protein [Exercitatus varius]|uniref:hypothetical protein n=1 Tax=Exercitatus varius TaxID=67857 RepID=UPI00294B5589|nr:hypothetical protein [Exercitatus varius]MDG2944693.1 hypothetical protein [Exercitatus varius]